MLQVEGHFGRLVSCKMFSPYVAVLFLITLLQFYYASGLKIDLNLRGKLRKTMGFTTAKTLKGGHVCSPISALLPIGKLAYGAEGKTLQNLKTAIGVNILDEAGPMFKDLIHNLETLPNVELSIASNIYVSNLKNLSNEFLTQTKHVFKHNVQKLDFKSSNAATQINDWVSTHTKHKIKDLVTERDVSSSSVIIVNAVYFNGNWKHQFPIHKTEQNEFYGGSEDLIVHMMNQDMYVPYAKSSLLDAQIISIPYRGDKASLIVVLPKKRKGLKTMLKNSKDNAKILKGDLASMKMAHVRVSLPKFRIETKIDLETVYTQVGLDLFSRHAKLHGVLADHEALHINKAVQKAFIEVNEHGTEAAAASAVQSKMSLKPSVEYTFRANHPFFFMVVANGEQLFTGTFYGR